MSCQVGERAPLHGAALNECGMNGVSDGDGEPDGLAEGALELLVIGVQVRSAVVQRTCAYFQRLWRGF